MRATARIARGIAALVLLVGLLVGVPVLLIVVAGYPLPSKMPDWNNVYWAARQGNLTSTFIIKALACVVWLAWAQLAWAILWEIAVNVPTITSGRRRRSTPFTFAPTSRLAHQLVYAVLVLAAISSASSPAVAQPPTLQSLVSPPSSTATAVVATEYPTASAKPTPPTATSALTYRVVENDTLWDVAERCLGDGARVDEITHCNPHLSTSRRLRAGQVIELPSHARVPTFGTERGASLTSVHVVVRGETLWGIIEDHYGSATRDLVDAVAAHNSIDNASLIHPGDTISLPDDLASGPARVEVDRNVHIVVEGDTLWGIVEDHYGAVDTDTVWAVAAISGLENPSLIFPGQRINLPDHLLDVGQQNHLPPTGERHDEPSPSDPVGDRAVTVSDSPHPSTPPAPQPPSDAPGVGVDSEPSPTITVTDEPPRPEPAPAAPNPPTTAPSESSAVAEPPPLVPASHDGAGVDSPANPDASDGSEGSAQARQERETVDHARSELVSARWLFGGAATTALGLAGAWMTLRRLRTRRRRWLDLPQPTAAAVTAMPDDDAHTQRSIDAIRALVTAGPQPSPAGIGAVLESDGVTVMFDDPRPAPAPGWEATGLGWHRAWGTDFSGSPSVLSPSLVTLGSTDSDDAEILLDLAAVGSVSVRGDASSVERMLCSMLWELASQPLEVGVELYVVGLACAASRLASTPGQLIDLSAAAAVASQPLPHPERLQVFLVDPFGEHNNTTQLNALVSACTRGSGRAVVVAGACEQPGEEVFVPAIDRATWRGRALHPPQLPEDVDRQLAATLSAVVVGRRQEPRADQAAHVFDPEAEAASLRSVALLADTDDPQPPHVESWDGINDDTENEPPPQTSAQAAVPAETPAVLLRTAGRQVEVIGASEPVISKAELAVTFLLAAAGREMHGTEISELTGYSLKTLKNSVTAAHPLVERSNGVMKLRDGVLTDHAWATECVRQLAAAIEAGDSIDQDRWLRSGFEILRSAEQGPYAVVPAKARSRRNGISPWSWVDDFPTDVAARDCAETELAEAGLAYTELWRSLPASDLVRSAELVNLLTRLAMVVPYAAVIRQVRTSTWSNGAECLLEAAMLVANDDPALQQRVQRTARAMVARQQLEATDELADVLGL